MLNLITNDTQVNWAIIFNFRSNNIPAGIFFYYTIHVPVEGNVTYLKNLKIKKKI